MSRPLRNTVACLGPVQTIVRHTRGSPRNVELTPLRTDADIEAVAAVLVLARCGMSLLGAKRAIERLLDEGAARLRLALAPDLEDLTAEMNRVGVIVRDLDASSASRREEDGRRS